MQVLEGTQRLSLTWTYQAPHGLDIQRTVFSIDDGITVDDIGLLYHLDNGSAYAIIYDRNDYRTRFKISTSEMATLIINNVTGNERATFQCKLETKSNGYWAYNIRINQLTRKIWPNACYHQSRGGWGNLPFASSYNRGQIVLENGKNMNS